jgi:hypothetical protein
MSSRVRMLFILVTFYFQIYSIFSALLKFCLVTTASLTQEINAFKTISSGNYSNPAIWEIFNGATWTAAIAKPGVGNHIYIDQKHLVNLIGNNQSESVLINAETGAAKSRILMEGNLRYLELRRLFLEQHQKYPLLFETVKVGLGIPSTAG